MTALVFILHHEALSQHLGHFVVLTTGYSHITTRNDAVSPLLSAGSSARYSIGYCREKSKNFQSAEINYSRMVAVSSAGSPSDITYGSIEYKYYQKLSKGKSSRYQLGLGGETATYAINRIFAPKFTNSERTIVISATLSSAAYVRYSLSHRDRLTMACQFGLLGYTVISGYAQTAPDQLSGEDNFGNIITSGHLLFIDEILTGGASLSYECDLSDRLFFEISNKVRYLRIINRRIFSFAENSIVFSLAFKVSK